MRGMPRVVTLTTWVSPRWNSAEPWVIGKRSISADSGRRSVTLRPSMRTPSSTMRRRTSFLVTDFTAALISPCARGTRSTSCSRIAAVAASSAPARSALVVTLLASASGASAHGVDAREDVVLVVETGLVVHGLDAATRGDERLDQLALEVDGLADPELGGLEASGEDLFGDLRRAVGVLLERALGAAGLDHHDGDVGLDRVAERATGDDELEDGRVALGVGRVRRPTRRRWCRPCARRRWGRRRGCPRSSARPRRR